MKADEDTIKKKTPIRKKDNYKRLEPEDPVSGTIFVDQVMDRFDIDLNDPSNLVMIHWKDIVEPNVSDYSKPQKIKDGVLYLVCNHPSRASYIRLNSREILKGIKSVFPEIELKKIVTRIR